MTLRLIREPSVGGVTIGVLFLDDRFQCFTLEDEIRERPGRPVAEWKVPGETAIPAGRYEIVVTYSNRFKKHLPLLASVPGFDGIRIHAGNSAGDTAGCVLVGSARSGVLLLHSAAALSELQGAIEASIARGARVFIIIENPLSFSGAA